MADKLCQTPAVEQRSRLVVADDGSPSNLSKKLLFVDAGSNNDQANTEVVLMPFGKSSEDLKTIFLTIVTGNFLSKDRITRALLTGFQTEFMLGNGQYGPLASLVQDVGQSLTKRVEDLTEGERIFLWMLTEKDTKDKDHQRTHLAELLVFLAETASQPNDPVTSRQCTKDFTLFLLRNVLFTSRNETAIKYERLLQSLQLVAPNLDRVKYPDLYRTHAKNIIVAHIVGNKHMESVVTLFDRKVKAFRTATASERKKDSKILPKRAQIERLKVLWGTDDFDKKEFDVEDEVAFFVSGQPTRAVEEVAMASPSMVVPPKTNNGTATDPVQGATTKALDSVKTQGTSTTAMLDSPKMHGITSTTLDSVALAELVSDFARVKGCAEKKGSMTLDDVKYMCEFILDPHLNAVFWGLGIDAASESVLVDGAPTLVSVDSSESKDPLAIGSSNENDPVAPLTVERQEGITVTLDGLRRSFQNLCDRSTDSDCKHLLPLVIKKGVVPDSWHEPVSDVDPILAGLSWVIEDFDIMGILGGGNFGRVLDMRHTGSGMRLCGKIESFNFLEYSTCFCNEMVESTKVKHPNIVRTLGYFAIPWLGDHLKPICMCILQEQGHYNLRKIVEELNGSSELAPMKKLRTVMVIMNQVLSPVEALEEAGVLHRDIKPENIVYFKDGFWKLVDFGLARDYDENETLTHGAGTGKYIPPEGKGPKHDSFSAGIVMYELMCGECPLEKVPSQEELAQAFHGIENEAAQQAVDLCNGLTLASEILRWTGKKGAGAAKKLLGLLSN